MALNKKQQSLLNRLRGISDFIGSVIPDLEQHEPEHTEELNEYENECLEGDVATVVRDVAELKQLMGVR